MVVADLTTTKSWDIYAHQLTQKAKQTRDAFEDVLFECEKPHNFVNRLECCTFLFCVHY